MDVGKSGKGSAPRSSALQDPSVSIKATRTRFLRHPLVPQNPNAHLLLSAAANPHHPRRFTAGSLLPSAGDHDAVALEPLGRRVRRGQEAADTEAAVPELANVALVVGSTDIVGAALVDMLQSPDNPGGPWKVYALSRRPLPPWSAAAAAVSSSTSSPNAVVHLQVDFADTAAVAAALEPLTDITHIFYTAWYLRHALEAHRATFRNVLSIVATNCPALVHVCLQSDRNRFVDPFDPLIASRMLMYPCSCSENLPRLGAPLDLEDVLFHELPSFVRPRRDFSSVTWSMHYTATVFGFSARSGRNIVASLCVYAAICCKEGAVLRWPGSLVSWGGFSDASDTELVAEHALWAALDLGGKNKAFNCSNGDVFKWKQLWPALAKHFEVEWSGYDGEDKRFKLEAAMAGKELLWADIVREKGLVETELDDITAWWFVDANINADKERLENMNKSKESGFLGFRDTVRSFDTWIGKMKAG